MKKSENFEIIYYIRHILDLIPCPSTISAGTDIAPKYIALPCI